MKSNITGEAAGDASIAGRNSRLKPSRPGGWRRRLLATTADPRPPPRPQTSSFEFWSLDLSPKQIAANERHSREALALVPGMERFASSQRAPKPLPGLLDPVRAASERQWYVRTTRHLARAHLRHCRRRGIAVRRYALTAVPYRWMIEPDRLEPGYIREVLPKWRKQAQRWASNLPANSFVAGMIEASLDYDEKYGFFHWCFHLHLLVHVPATSEPHGRAQIRTAFTMKNREALGVTQAFHCAPISPIGESRGWLRYLSKGLQVHAVHRRRVGYEERTGKRLRSSKNRLSVRELAPWAALVSQLRAEDLMIWVGYQRYGERVVAKLLHPR